MLAFNPIVISELGLLATQPDQQAESTNHSTNTLGSHGPLSQTTGGTKVGHVKIVGEDGSFALFVAQVSREAALDTSRTPGRHFIVDE